MKLLDLFCGSGGLSAGYVRAGFEVTGVDHVEQPRYLASGASAFVQADAIAYASAHARDYDVVSASPPCQSYSSMARFAGSTAPRLVDLVRAVLQNAGRPHVIENAPGAPLRGNVVMLCGTMFGLRVRRHRLFEFSEDVGLLLTPDCDCRDGVRDGRLIGHRLSRSLGPGRYVKRLSTPNEMKEAMGVGWMEQRGMRQAIPPAYGEYIGRHLFAHVVRQRERAESMPTPIPVTPPVPSSPEGNPCQKGCVP